MQRQKPIKNLVGFYEYLISNGVTEQEDEFMKKLGYLMQMYEIDIPRISEIFEIVKNYKK